MLKFIDRKLHEVFLIAFTKLKNLIIERVVSDKMLKEISQLMRLMEKY